MVSKNETNQCMDRDSGGGQGVSSERPRDKRDSERVSKHEWDIIGQGLLHWDKGKQAEATHKKVKLIETINCAAQIVEETSGKREFQGK